MNRFTKNNKWLLLCCVLCVLIGCGDGTVSNTPAFKSEEVAKNIDNFCGACHPTPKPEYFTKEVWIGEVQRGFQLYEMTQRTDLDPPKMHQVVEYYRQLAPNYLPWVPDNPDSPSPINFEKQESVRADGPQRTLPTIAHIHTERNDRDQLQLILSDMNTGELLKGHFDEQLKVEHLTQVSNPCRVNASDLNGDGIMDWVVADLGNYYPATDHSLGMVWWLDIADDGTLKPQLLVENLGRVADVKATDLDGDGDQDLLVAVFGWLATGEILAFENLGNSPEGVPQFKPHLIDGRHGAIEITINDINGDGLPDFVVLMGQEIEALELFVNQGNFDFERQLLYTSENIAYGSSGFQLVDLDLDSDIDILYTNGDTFDSRELRPYHSVQWLENDGAGNFTHHHISSMPGVFRAVADDLDNDGDMDIAAVAFLPKATLDQNSDINLDSIVWFEQTDPGVFNRHVLESKICRHTALVIEDVDNDGRKDLIVSQYHLLVDEGTKSNVDVWFNKGPATQPTE